MKHRPLHEANLERTSWTCIFNTFASCLLHRVKTLSLSLSLSGHQCHIYLHSLIH